MSNRYLTLPNALSILRIFLLIPIVLLYYNDFFILTFALFFISAISDALDGRIARAWNMESDFGRMLDPLADKITFVSLIVLFGWNTLFHGGIATLVILELCLFIVGTDAYYNPYPNGYFILGANKFGKAKTGCETILIGLLILWHFLNIPHAALLNILLFICILLAIKSIIGHIRFKPLS
ncbi:MAG: CDP-alcohol phosphatidyltransferase family protein [bacterium]|nr:CDP-alcohol phosphatidyltransferase family protein [bacterium]